jgi:hypothetical protein
MTTVGVLLREECFFFCSRASKFGITGLVQVQGLYRKGVRAMGTSHNLYRRGDDEKCVRGCLMWYTLLGTCGLVLP